MDMIRKPPIVKAKVPGICYVCGQPIYVGDKIRISQLKVTGFGQPTTVAWHKECD